MVRYFINYEDFIENTKINKEINLFSPELYIIKKHKNYYEFEPIIYFKNHKNELLDYAKRLNYDKKGILMVELTEDELNKFDNLIIKKYEKTDNNLYKKVFEKTDEIISLIGFKSLLNMNSKELENGNIVAMMPCASNNKYMYISADRGVLANELSLFDRRNALLKKNIGCDIYFHTKDEEILKRYEDDIITVKEIDFHTYELVNNKLFVIDPINNNEIRYFTSKNYYLLDILNQDSIPVYITKIDNGYLLDINDKSNYNYKGYIINNINFNKLLNNETLEPLIKYINIYKLDNGVYEKISIEKYLENQKSLKLLRKNFNE